MFNNVSLIYHIIKLSNNVGNTKEVFEIGNSLLAISRGLPSEKVNKIFTEADPGLKDLYEGNYKELLEEEYNFEELLKLPQNTLGYLYAKHMTDRGFKADFYDKLPTPDLPGFTINWIGKTHDIMHVLAGFDTDEAGEIGLQAFYAGNFPNSSAICIMIAGLLSVVKKGDVSSINQIMHYITTGYANGKNAKKLISVKWGKRYWQRDIEELRKEFDIKRFR